MFYSPQTFKMATRPLFVPVNMSTVVPFFNSTAPTAFFSFTTLTLFSFSYWTTIKAIFRNVVLSKTVEKSDQPMKSTFKDERQMESFLFPTRAWSRRWFGNCHWLAKRVHWLALLRSQEKRAKLFCLSWPVLFSWVMDTLDPSSDDDINNDVNSLYIEIIEQECTICGRKLSRKQRLETHLSCVNGQGEK